MEPDAQLPPLSALPLLLTLLLTPMLLVSVGLTADSVGGDWHAVAEPAGLYADVAARASSDTDVVGQISAGGDATGAVTSTGNGSRADGDLCEAELCDDGAVGSSFGGDGYREAASDGGITRRVARASTTNRRTTRAAPRPTPACAECYSGDHVASRSGIAAACAECDAQHVSQVIEAIKRRVLSGLKMEAPPNVSVTPVPSMVAQLALDVQRRRESPQSQPDGWATADGARAQTEAMWIFASTVSAPLAGSWQASQVLRFELPSQVALRTLRSATIMVRVADVRRHLQRGYVFVHKVISSGSSHKLKKFVIKKITAESLTKKFVSLSVTKLVTGWLRRPQDNLGVVVGAGANATTIGNITLGDDATRPILHVRLEPGGHRSRRNTNFCSWNGTEKRCCLFPLQVDFHKFGWYWILSPSRYQANFCHGDCPSVYLQQYPHTHIAQQVGGNSGPCCSPRRLGTLQMLYWDQNSNIRFAVLPKMLVHSCGCQ